MLQGRYPRQIVRPVDILLRMALARGWRLLDDMVNFIPFLGLAGIPLQRFERFRATAMREHRGPGPLGSIMWARFSRE